jgi:multidrug efflux pump subunit AcrA (membrane-fusion protein)
VVDRAELQRREAQSRLDNAAARLLQARHAREYAELKAPADGVLIDVTGEPGQVVAPGQTVATLARGTREIEVFLPDGVAAPARGTALDERGQQAQVWRVRDGRTQAVPVRVIMLDDRTVRVAGVLQPDDRVVALGTHLLREGMTVRERVAP